MDRSITINPQIKKINNSFSCVYGLGVIGAAIYFIGNAVGFWAGVVGFLKALVWPAYLVFELFTFLGV